MRRNIRNFQYLTKRAQSTINLASLIENLKPRLIPPVSNQMLFDQQLKIMVVGGPNQRNDFHINNGEEFFFQQKGTMELKLAYGDSHRTIKINEGEFFLLPSDIPHSPQRFNDTIGLVFERQRLIEENDGLMWFVPGTTKVLHKTSFHCEDLVTQLKESIQQFNNSKISKTLIPETNIPVTIPSSISKAQFDNLKPFNLKQVLDSIYDIRKPISVGKELTIQLFRGEQDYTCLTKQNAGDVFLWQYSGRSTIHTLPESTSNPISNLPPPFHLEEGEICLLPLDSKTDYFVSQMLPWDRLISITNNVTRVESESTR